MADKVDIYDTKRVATKVRRAVDFAGQMEAGDTVQSVQVSASDSQGTAVTNDLIESPTPSGTQVRWTHKAWGTNGANYYVRVVATTTGGDVLPAVVQLTIEGL